jgi:tetratricopeptide (TPR) repeat protein
MATLSKAKSTSPAASGKRRRILPLAAACSLVLGGLVFADYWSARPPETARSFVGRRVCSDCHREQYDAFTGSHHDLAMDLAGEDTVVGDFDNATLAHDGLTSRMFRDGERFMVHTEGEDGAMQDFQVKYVFGVEPLQQYMVEFDRPETMPADEIARLQVLRISWDTQNKRWFYLRPPDVADKLEPDDPLHWTGIAQRWQTMCAECHSTDLRSNFNPKSLQYHTTFSEIDVSCEACHGPASLHVELATEKSLFWDRRHGYGLAKLKGENAEPQLQACAPCHSRRSQLTDAFHAGDTFCDHFNLELLRDDTYFADGQIKDEVYVYGSFIQSRMYHKNIRCTDCHDPHSLKLKHSGNATCTSCHQHAAGKYDVPSHHHHKPGTPGSMCVDCHMPERTYMDVDPRRDHSLRVPRPDLSVKLGTPNACSGCHVADRLDTIDIAARNDLKEYADWQLAATANPQVAEAIGATDKWCDEAVDRWYGELRKTPPQFAEAVVAFRSGDDGAIRQMLQLALQPTEEMPAIARASALSELAANGVAQAVPTAKQILQTPSEDPIVRAAAANVFMACPDARKIRRALMPLLKDDSRLVRVEAARVLTGSGAYQTLSGAEQATVDNALKEVKASIMLTNDRAAAYMAWAMLCEARGRFNEAVEAYETAIRVQPTTTGPRTNFAALLERMASQTDPTTQAKVMERVSRLRSEELPLLGRDAGLAPENASVQYRYGLALYLAGKLDEAMEKLERAAELAPKTPDFRQARDLLREKMAEQ